jgi:hypothetical protein
MFQTDGQKDGFQWPGMGHVNSGLVVEFGPVEKAIEDLLVFFAQSPPKGRCGLRGSRQRCGRQVSAPSTRIYARDSAMLMMAPYLQLVAIDFLLKSCYWHFLSKYFGSISNH